VIPEGSEITTVLLNFS